MQTITTKFSPATATKGSRVIAKASGESNRIKAECGFHYGPESRDAHREAVRRLMEKLGWQGTMLAGKP